MFPTGKLTSVTPDPTRHDTLIIRWTAEDKNLTDKPISLEWSPRADGPWEFIGGSELPNTGSFAWQVPPAAAAATSVFLKITIRDGAGNVWVSPPGLKPQMVDMNIPEVGGVSVSPIQPGCGVDSNPSSSNRSLWVEPLNERATIVLLYVNARCRTTVLTRTYRRE